MNDSIKSELRSFYKSVRNSINQDVQEEKSKIITDLFMQNFSFANNYFTYLSFGSEVRTGDIIHKLREKHKNILIPKCDTDKLTMSSVRYCADDFLQKNSYGILENNNADLFGEKIDVILLPALTADRQGNRIGFGKGYYDKFINSLNYRPILIALCYKEQIFDGVLPNEEHDAKLDYIVTDDGIIRICEK